MGPAEEALVVEDATASAPAVVAAGVLRWSAPPRALFGHDGGGGLRHPWRSRLTGTFCGQLAVNVAVNGNTVEFGWNGTARARTMWPHRRPWRRKGRPGRSPPPRSCLLPPPHHHRRPRPLPPSPLLPLALVLLAWCCAAAGCPPACDCKWKSGKEAVICVNANLSAIPRSLDAGTQVLDLTGNAIHSFKADAFYDAGLENLQKVYLARCGLKALDKYAFRKLTNLVELDLSYNQLPSIPSHVFDSISELRELKLSGNPIQRIKDHAFVAVPQLVRLELSGCRLGTLEPRALVGLERSLEWLRLDDNQLMNVRAETVMPLVNLHGLELAGNPWNCSCTLLPMRRWMLRQNIPYDVSPSCGSPPRLAGRSWEKLELDEFACAPRISAPAAAATGVEGRNVTMSCEVGGVPEPKVRWLLRNRVIANLSSTGRKLYLLHADARASNLTILSADVADAGAYVCRAENKAGKAEARVTLAVLRRPPDEVVAGPVLAAGLVVAALAALAAALAALCVCGVRRRRRRRNRAHAPEKIELNHTALLGAASGGTAGSGGSQGGGGVSGGAAGGGANGELAGSPGVRQHGAYRGVAHADGGVRLSGRANGGSVGADAAARVDDADPPTRSRHPRLAEYRGLPSADLEDDEEGGYEDEVETPTPTGAGGGEGGGGGISGGGVVGGGGGGARLWGDAAATDVDTDTPTPDAACLWAEGGRGVASLRSPDLHIPRLQDFAGRREPSMAERAAGNLQRHVMRRQTVGGAASIYTSEVADPETAYPDLLELAPYSGGGSGGGGGSDGGGSSSFCTLPRRRTGGSGGGVGSRYRAAGSDSQSPLLPGSRYGSDASSESYYPAMAASGGGAGGGLSGGMGGPPAHARSSFNLASAASAPASAPSPVPTAAAVAGSCGSAQPAGGPRPKNPSVPSSPSATPLLNLGAAAAVDLFPNAYDYHATQLERFLEEYRSLQEQLNKMKASIRHEPATTGARSPPAVSTAGVVDPPPYWLPRRFSGGDFFQS